MNSMEDHIIRVPTGINSAAFFSQHRLPILKRRGTAKDCSGETVKVGLVGVDLLDDGVREC